MQIVGNVRGQKADRALANDVENKTRQVSENLAGFVWTDRTTTQVANL
jgi:hypothetical protein